MEIQSAIETKVNNGIGMKKVLIVDDILGVREVLSDFLRMQGYQTFEAENGLVALDILQEHAPDLAIVDIEMPEMNGLEFSRRALEKNPDLPVIIISAYLEKYSQEYIRSLGIQKMFRKPIDLTQLNETIKRILA